MDNIVPKFSIIIPVYNSENYIGKALDSLLNQNFEGYEIILVNDGSTDRSRKICEQYEKNYANVLLFNEKNGGLCSARNKGIEVASGRYIMFMDNDDEFQKDSLNIIWNSISKLRCDILRFNRTRIQVFDNGKRKIDIYGCKNIVNVGDRPKYVTREELFKNYRSYRKSGCFAGIWNGVYKKELFKDIRFDTSIKAGGEDWLVNLQLYELAQSVGFISDSLYIYYRRVSHSISTTYQTNRIDAIVKCANLERKLIESNSIDLTEILYSDIRYIAQIIKIMMHKESHLKMKDKVEILNNISLEPGLNVLDISNKIRKLSMLYKIYMILYIKKRYCLLILLSEVILKLRGNT